MNEVTEFITQQSWFLKNEYPFTHRYIGTPAGQMHYVDEGSGSPIVLVHGTPGWSFEYRAQVAELSKQHRVIAADHIGFGMSDKPAEANYSYGFHYQNLKLLIETLELKDITLVVHDLGGPIGIKYAIEHPNNVKNMVLMNTLFWPEQTFLKMKPIIDNFMMRWLYLYFNFSAKVMIPKAWGNKKLLSPQHHKNYVNIYRNASERHGTWGFAKSVGGEVDWYNSLWEQKSALQHIKTQIIWGMKDEFFPPAMLATMKKALPHASVLELPNTGHFVQDESPAEVTACIRSMLQS